MYLHTIISTGLVDDVTRYNKIISSNSVYISNDLSREGDGEVLMDFNELPISLVKEKLQLIDDFMSTLPISNDFGFDQAIMDLRNLIETLRDDLTLSYDFWRLHIIPVLAKFQWFGYRIYFILDTNLVSIDDAQTNNLIMLGNQYVSPLLIKGTFFEAEDIEDTTPISLWVMLLEKGIIPITPKFKEVIELDKLIMLNKTEELTDKGDKYGLERYFNFEGLSPTIFLV